MLLRQFHVRYQLDGISSAVYMVTCPPTDAAAVAKGLRPVFPFIDMFLDMFLDFGLKVRTKNYGVQNYNNFLSRAIV